MNPQDKTENTFSDIPSWKMGADLKEGSHVGRYQILGLIGKGGMGSVYKAYDPKLDRSIAIKILTVKPEEGETASRPQARLMREAQALAKLSHPNVVAVHDVGTFEDGVYIAMEYVKGMTLREWIKEEQPALKETLRILLEAGKGLQAAHAEGIIHRDFKPDNVLIGDKGQVKVLDFGLARAAGATESSVPKEKSKPNQESCEKDPGEKLLSAPLTRVGAMVGTTVYMAPEHFEFKELDEKTDQFSFCVTLFESLYGKRPFPGKTVEELEENITSGWIEIPQEADVPKWIEEIIRKGISISKDDRYASMLDMLNALDDDPEIAKRKRRKRLFIGALLLLMAVMTLGFGYFAFFRSSKMCTGAVQKVAGVWNDERKEKIRQSFANTGLSYANDSFVRVEKRLGDYLNKWATFYTETCEATRLRDEQPVEIMVLKMGCLDKHLINAGALARVFANADKTVVQKSVQAVASLSGFSNCKDVEALQSKIPTPKDEQTKTKVEEIRDKLAKVEAFVKTGKYQDGLKLAKKIEIKAKEVDYQPVQAEILYCLGVLLQKIGEYKESETNLKNAAKMAGKSRDSLLAAKAMVMLVWVVGYEQARDDAGLSFALNAEVMLDVAGGGERTRAQLLSNLGVFFSKQARYDKALECHRKSLAIREKLLGPDHLHVALSLNNLGLVFKDQGKYDKALEYLHKSLAILEKVIGHNHPHLAMSLNNMGTVFSLKGEYDRAQKHYLEALSIRKKALGTNHPHVATSLNNIGTVFFEKGEYDKALEYLSRSLIIKEKALGSEHPLVAYTLNSIGILLVEQGRSKQTLKHFERAAAICEKMTCQPEPHGVGLFGLARALVETKGDKQRAIKLAKQAREIFDKTPKRFKKELEEVGEWLEKNDGSATPEIPRSGSAENISTAKR